MPFQLDMELSSVRITRRREVVELPDDCPNCRKPLRGPKGVGFSVQGLTFSEIGAKVPDAGPPLHLDDYTDYSDTKVDTGLSCGACGAFLHGDDVIMTPPRDCDVPPPAASPLPLSQA
ncbi:hypothetical protein [Pyxidicoccus sp. MSG2]|uniref:hypothetical protein n=1 Tax=Pyxidicoccus sp. MSG2 TaxID=2996790 RepID=UPI002271E951|nr:hypothetical protein [Pyxidicoccus sp. MSG2]MCY1024058.1 hypothetical protein [Pyxidicoccus sp. MSG2]